MVTAINTYISRARGIEEMFTKNILNDMTIELQELTSVIIRNGIEQSNIEPQSDQLAPSGTVCYWDVT